MKTTITALFLSLASGVYCQNLSEREAKLEPCERQSYTKETNEPVVVSFRNTPIWEETFDILENWIAAGPAGASGIDYGWSIGDTTNSWYEPFDNTMGTSGTFARFKNGTNTSFYSDGPFTFSYSGSINLTEEANPFLEFHQYGARFRTFQAVQISLDGLEWITVADNNDLPITSSFAQHIYPKPMLKRVRLAPFLSGDLSAVQIRLYWDGQPNGDTTNYMEYGWYVDNLKIVSGYEHDVAINYATAHFMGIYGYSYSRVPQQAQSTQIEFKVHATNNGNQTEEVFLNVTNNSGYNKNSPTVVLESGESTTLVVGGNQAFTNYLDPTAFVYQVKSNNELEFLDDDFAQFSFSKSGIHESQMAVDRFNGNPNSMTGGFQGWMNGSGTQGIGAFFEILGGYSTHVGYVEIGIANVHENQQQQYIGNAVHAEIWGYNDDHFIFFGTTESHVLEAEDFGKILFLKANTIGECIPTSGNRLLVLACFEANEIVPIAYSGTTLFESVIGRNDGAFHFLSPTNSGGIFSDAPVVRPFFVCPLSVPEYVENLTQVDIYPNPVSDVFNMELTLQFEDEIIVIINDMAGKTVKTFNVGYLAANTHNLTFDVEDLAQGMYVVAIFSGLSIRTYKLTVR